MPGFTTHYLFGIKTYRKLKESSIKKMISSNLPAYQLGLQGPDIFFYYLPHIVRYPSHVLASIMHEVNTGLFFENYIKEASNFHHKKRDIAYAYLSGFLNHYCLDTICHPYIYARTNYSLTLKETSKSKDNQIYYAKHRSFETLLDSLILGQYKHIKPSEFLKENTILLDKQSINIITTLLSSCITKTYYNKLIPSLTRFKRSKSKRSVVSIVPPEYIHKVLHSVRLECRVLSKLTGNKRQFIEYVEDRFINYNLLSSLIPSDEYEDKEDVLNLSLTTWYSPWEPETKRNDSFLKLLHIATKKCTTILNLLSSFLSNREMNQQNKSRIWCKEIKLIMGKIGNNSYHSGLCCNTI